MAVKTRWDKKTYRRHMFNRGRGVHSPHEATNTHQGTAEFIDSQLKNGGSWWEGTWRSPFAGKLSAAKEYEQYNNPASLGISPFTFDSEERRKFRDQDRKEVRQLFAQALKDHHFVQSRKVTQGRLSKIVDAYMSQDDDKFQKTLRSMGVSDRDAVRFTRAAEDAASKAIEEKNYDGSWSDDPYQKSPVTHSTNGGSEPPKGPTNGRTQVKTVTATDTTRNNSRDNPGPVQSNVTTVNPYNKTSSSDSGVRLNGAPVNSRDTSTVNNIQEAQKESAKTDALQARRIRQRVQNDMRSDGRRLEQEHMANQDALDASLTARSDRLRAEREAAHKKRMDKRYESRTLTGMSDWENLGRNSTKRNFGARAEGESDESWNARSGAVEAVDKLRERFKNLGVKDADKNEFYAYNPSRMRDVSGLGNLFNKAVASGKLTDAQIEGINKTLDTYEGEGRKTKATLQRNAAMRDAENVRKYREMYGMGDRDVFSDDDVKKFHADRQAASRKEILQNMQVAPGQGGAEGQGQRIRDFSDNWMKLVDNGLDVTGTFKKSMSNEANRKAYQEGIAGIAADDPERADKMDQLRRRFVMNQAMSDAGLTDRMVKPAEGQTLGTVMAKGLPGTYGLPSDPSVAEDNLPDDLADETGASKADTSLGATGAAEKPEPGASAAEALKSRYNKEDTRQAAKGGMVLRPRRRAS